MHWRLLTAQAIADAAAAWQGVDWDTARWTVEQLWRLLKTQGLRLEDSQIDTAGKLLKLAAVATRAATVVLQLNQARGGAAAAAPAAIAFQEHEIAARAARAGARTARQSNPHPKHSRPRAAWIVARLGGWDGYASSRPPRTHHPQARPRQFLCHRNRMDPPRSVHALARRRGWPSSLPSITPPAG